MDARVLSLDRLRRAQFPFLGDFLTAVGTFLASQKGGQGPVDVLLGLAAVLAGTVIVGEPRLAGIAPWHPRKMTTPCLVETLCQFRPLAISEDPRVGVAIAVLGDEMEDLFEARIKASPARGCLLGVLKLAAVETLLMPFFGVDTIESTVAGGHYQERIARGESFDHQRVVRFAILIVVEVLS